MLIPTTSVDDYPIIQPINYLSQGVIVKAFGLFLSDTTFVHFDTLEECEDYALESIDEGRFNRIFMLISESLCQLVQ
jgi:hypothetical protein